MAKVQGPLLSVSASGALARLVCYEARGGASVVRKSPKPTAPASAAQMAERQKAKDAASAWNALDPTERAEWFSLSSAQGIPPFARYLHEWHAQASTPAQPPFVPFV